MLAPRTEFERARDAVVELLEAIGARAQHDPELVDTPDRVARMYLDELLDGYRADIAKIAREGSGEGARGLVVLTGIRYASFCPHHFLPARGRADVGYVSTGRVAGLGTLVKIVEACAHRLVLQETLGESIAEALVVHLGASGAAVRLRARHDCLALRGERQRAASVVTVSYAGSMNADERAMFTRSLPARRRSR